MTLNIGITGTRQGANMKQMRRLRDYLQMLKDQQVDWCLHEGACEGVDHEMFMLAQEMGLKRIHCYPAADVPNLWRVHSQYPHVTMHEPKPPLDRDRDIVAACDHLIVVPATPQEVRRSGTWATWRYAKQAGKPYTIIIPSGLLRGSDLPHAAW